eukprot:CAMPEP_0196579842 /NCGR_PEP_ID=MMETSP1081-20130531/25134_1 /TAXON_ID=36882 /ORGANISM="Pyramimonas amylifera, Strain CCMP720" /LENGTH=309 /DNA_ID=CAMNT_0041899543 /DNA_START=213 /DNA_END=1142 /DNA_ORIENTATION=+
MIPTSSFFLKASTKTIQEIETETVRPVISLVAEDVAIEREPLDEVKVKNDSRIFVEESGEFEDNYFAPENANQMLMDGELLAGDILHSTDKHKNICYIASGLAAALLLQGASQTSTEAALLAVIAGYYFADFGSGVFHWSVDNYGDDKTPLVGGVIAAFQGHHLYPWTITKREFYNNVHKVAIPTLPFLAGSLIAPIPGWLDVFVSVSTVLVVLSQQFHSWSHTRKSQLPAPVVFLQDAGVLISRKGHGAHHKKPFESNYCIVSGAFNEKLDNDGFFRNLEKKIYDVNGVEPRCWNEPEYTWIKGESSK